MSQLLESSFYCVEQAKRRIAEFHDEVLAFQNGDPYAMRVDTNAERTEDAYKIVLTKPVPSALRGIAFEVVSHLRAALDQACSSCVRAATGKRSRMAKFPFGDTDSEVLCRVLKDAKHIPKEIFDAIVTLKPHKAGDHPLWALNKLCNTGKHDLVVPLPLYKGNSILHHMHDKDGLSTFNWPPKWDSTKNEMVITTVAHGAELHYKFEITLFVAIGKVEGLEGVSIQGFFAAVVPRVENALAVIGAKAAEIGLS